MKTPTINERLDLLKKHLKIEFDSDLEKHSGMSKSVVNQLRSGKIKSIGARYAFKLEDKHRISARWTQLGEGPMLIANAGKGMSPEEAKLLDDWRTLPEGWQFYICQRSTELKNIADTLPKFMKDSIRAIKDDSRYWDFERELEMYIREKRESVETGGTHTPLTPERPAIPDQQEKSGTKKKSK